MAAFIRESNIGAVWCDSSAKECIRELQTRGIIARKCASNNFYDRVTTFGSFLTLDEDGVPYMRISPACTNLIEEIGELEFADRKEDDERSGSDRWTRSTQDHGFDAACYSLQQVHRALGDPLQTVAVY